MMPQNIQYRRNLPHFHPKDHSIFITFNLANSIPRDVVEKLKAEHEAETKSLPIESSESYDIHMKYFERYDEWLDKSEHGNYWLQDEPIGSTVSKKIQSMDKQRYELLAFCIMPNHVHLLINSILGGVKNHLGTTAKYPITDTLRLLKGSTARECNLILKRTGSFWHHESYDHYVRDELELERIVKYILNNPVKAGLVKEWNAWKFTYISPGLGFW